LYLKSKQPIDLLLIISLCALAVQVLAVGPVRADCPSDMLAHYRLDEAEGDPFEESINGNNGFCDGDCPAAVPGRIAGAQDFSLISSAIIAAPGNAFDWIAQDSFSIEFWMNRDLRGLSSDEAVVGRNDQGTPMRWWAGLNALGKAKLVLQANNGHTHTLIGSTTIADADWHHVVAVRDADSDQTFLFVDGQLEAYETTIFNAGFESEAALLNLGWLDASGGHFFGGIIDEVAIYDRALTDFEIQQHANDGVIGLQLGYCGTEEPIRIMPLGDSITVGYIAGTSSDYLVGYRQKLYRDLIDLNYNIDFVGTAASGQAAEPVFDIDHEGHSGWTDDEILNGLVSQNWLDISQPDVVLLHIGTNDIDPSPDAVEGILDEIDSYDDEITVVLARIINRREFSYLTRVFNNNIEAMARDRIANGDKIIIVDQESVLTYPDDMVDSWHPVIQGYEKMADTWLGALTSFLPLSSQFSQPIIYSIPHIQATTGLPYICDVNAHGNPTPHYGLVAAPAGMSIDETTGLIEWLPQVTGDYDISVLATSTEGTYLQEYTLNVSDYDNRVDNGSPYYFRQGDWFASTLVPGYYGSDYEWTEGGVSGTSVTWLFDLPTSGYYRVSAWWSAPYQSRSPDAPYTIYHDGTRA